MKIVISPAKSLDFENKVPTDKATQFCFIKEAQQIDKILKKKSQKQLGELMDISPALSQLNFERNQARNFNDLTLARQAVYAFNGDVYLGLDIHSLPIDKLDALQEKVRILSGLYGILKPLDKILPYRLEMGTQLTIGQHKNLYEFWKTKITKMINDELDNDELFINLASNEYFSAIDSKKIKVPIITPEFKDYKDGKLKMISFFAKKARGMMVRYLIDVNATTLDDIKAFNYGGYLFDENLSKGNKLVFTR